jgi:hypothetical protein
LWIDYSDLMRRTSVGKRFALKLISDEDKESN